MFRFSDPEAKNGVLPAPPENWVAPRCNGIPDGSELVLDFGERDREDVLPFMEVAKIMTLCRDTVAATLVTLVERGAFAYPLIAELRSVCIASLSKGNDTVPPE